MMNRFILLILCGLCSALLLPGGAVSASPQQSQEELVVGIRAVPPFVMPVEEGNPEAGYEGITIALWEQLAKELEVDFRYEERDIAGLLNGVEKGELYAAASALTITAEREEQVDFTHPFYVSGLGIAVAYTPTSIWQAFMAIFSPDFLYIVGLLVLILLGAGGLLWLAERKANADEFGGSAAKGIGSGFWWAAVTMTTVGYGDKSPRSFAGRFIGFIWMFAGVIIISFFTASIASSLTVTQLDSRISGEEDLAFVRVGILQDSATRLYMEENALRYTSFATIDAGLDAVARGQIDAFVHDAPIIRYESSRSFRNEVRVLPNTFNDQYYGIALPAEAAYRNKMNQILLDYISSDAWKLAETRYGVE